MPVPVAGFFRHARGPDLSNLEVSVGMVHLHVTVEGANATWDEVETLTKAGRLGHFSEMWVEPVASNGERCIAIYCEHSRRFDIFKKLGEFNLVHFIADYNRLITHEVVEVEADDNAEAQPSNEEQEDVEHMSTNSSESEESNE